MLASASRVPRGGRRAPGGQRLPLEHQRHRIHHADHGVLRHPVALFQPEGEEPAADLRGHRHLGRFEVAEGVALSWRQDASGNEPRKAMSSGCQSAETAVSVTHGFSLAVRGVIPRVVRYLDRAWASSTRWRSSVSRASSTSVRAST